MATRTEDHREMEAPAQESMLSTVLWTGGALLVVAVIALYTML